MKKQTKKEQIISMIERPVPQKKLKIIKLKMVREGSVLYGISNFHSTKEAAEMMTSIFKQADREMMVVLSLDASYNPIAIEVVAVGGVSSCGIDMRDIFKHAILSNAAAIICFHNHPSGNPKPSVEDTRITERMKEAGNLLGIRLLDHIVMGENGGFFSFRENDGGVLKVCRTGNSICCINE